MTRGDILTKAIAIAKRNGFGISDDFFTEIPVETWLQDNQDLYFSLIFCHDFAICFFGENPAVVEDFADDAEDINLVEYEDPTGLLMTNRKNIRIPIWQYHLTQMVLSEDPLIYLSKFVQDYEQAELN
jgi:hypothetical protein